MVSVTKGEKREELQRKRKFSPRMHGKRLAEVVRNALRKRFPQVREVSIPLTISRDCDDERMAVEAIYEMRR